MTVLGSESTRREYAARMNRVVDHIQSHLNEPLELERVAAIACFSPFHFHRLFSAWMGETLQVFVHRLRLERAAQMLIFDQAKSVSEVAMECGFSSPGAFARAFRGAFGMPASEYRKSKICESNRKAWEAGQRASVRFSELAGPMPRSKEDLFTTRCRLEVQVRRLEPRTIAYLRHVGPYKGDTALFRRLFERLFAWAEPRGLMSPDMQYSA